MTPDELWIDMAQFDGAHADRIWDGSAATDDAPAWYGQVATLLQAAAAPTTDDELAGESDIVARMQAAILDPAPDEELAGESDIVARMQAAILELPAQGGDDDAGDSDRPRHLRPAGPSDGVRRRQGVRVVRRIVAVKAAAVTTVVAIGVTAAAATTGFVATVVVPALSTHEQKTFPTPKPSAEESGSSAEGGDGDHRTGDGEDGPLVMDLENPFECMIDLDCLLQEVEQAAAAPAGEADAGAAADHGTADSGAVTATTIPSDPSPPTTLATESPPSTTTTTEPTTTTTEPTTTTTEPTTTTTTEPPSGDAAAPAPAPADTLSDTGDTGRTTGASHRPLPAVAGG